MNNSTSTLASASASPNKVGEVCANGLQIDAIAPANGSKYSPNLYRWLTKKSRARRVAHSMVFKDDQGVLWIGEIHDDCFVGCKLIATLCNGAAEETAAYVQQSMVAALVSISDFWAHYMAIGRCAIDTDHSMHFINDDSRWSVSGETRHCQWCGNAEQTLRRWTEEVERSKWVTS